MPEPNVQCATCGKPIYRNPKQIAKSKTGLFYCCKKHQRILNLYKKTSYRKAAFEHFPHKCDNCGYDKLIDILEVHHVNFEHNDNHLYNLQILCPTCHREIHHMNKINIDYDNAWDPSWDEIDWDL